MKKLLIILLGFTLITGCTVTVSDDSKGETPEKEIAHKFIDEISDDADQGNEQVKNEIEEPPETKFEYVGDVTVVNPCSDDEIVSDDISTCWFVSFTTADLSGTGMGCFMIDSPFLDIGKLSDDVIKETWRISDEEYDYIVEVAQDDELSLLINEKPTYAEIKSILKFIDAKLEKMN